jgi:uncharacterized protein YbjT (DUF2867 family)
MSLVIVGATGGLGMEVAKGLVTSEGFDAKKALVRDASSEKARTLSDLGWTVVEVNDMLGDKVGLEEALAVYIERQ